MKDPIEIYVACLASYNAGILHGEWIDATQDEADIKKAIAEMLKASSIPDAEEWAIHNYSGFGSIRLDENESLSQVLKLARLLDRHGNLAFALMGFYEQDIDNVYDVLQTDRCITGFDSTTSFIRNMVHEDEEIPKFLLPYINYEAIARDWEKVGELALFRVDGQIIILFPVPL